MMNRSFLRLLTINALSNGFTEPYPTIAQNRIFDSRLQDANIDPCETVLPYVGVYTAGHDFEIGGNGSVKNYNMFNDVELNIELSVFGLRDTGDDGVEIITDQYLAIKLDILEQQIFDILFQYENPHSDKWRCMVTRLIKMSSSPEASDDGNFKIAMRTLSMSLRLCEEQKKIRQDPDIISFIDQFPKYKYLLDLPEYADELKSILITNSNPNNLNSVEIKLNSNAGENPAQFTTIEVDNLNE